MAPLNARTEFNTLIAWLRTTKAPNPKDFSFSCDKVAFLASAEAKVLHPAALRGSGYVSLDYAAKLLGTLIPADVLFSGLPGYTRLKPQVWAVDELFRDL